jgi:hypothetical protein
VVEQRAGVHQDLERQDGKRRRGALRREPSAGIGGVVARHGSRGTCFRPCRTLKVRSASIHAIQTAHPHRP